MNIVKALAEKSDFLSLEVFFYVGDFARIDEIRNRRVLKTPAKSKEIFGKSQELFVFQQASIFVKASNNANESLILDDFLAERFVLRSAKRS